MPNIPSDALEGPVPMMLEALGCDCCSSILNLDMKERNIQQQPGCRESTTASQSIPLVDYDDGPLGMYAPSMPRAAIERASRPSSPAVTPPNATAMSYKSTYIVQLSRRDGERLGLDVDYKQERNSLPIVSITGGVAERWNAENPDQPLAEGDNIIEANGTSQDAAAMVRVCQGAQDLCLTLVRGSGQTDEAVRPAEGRARDCLVCTRDGQDSGKFNPWTWLIGGSACIAN